MRELGIEVEIYARPNEKDPAIPFAGNTVNKSYNKDATFAIWQAMLKILKKCSILFCKALMKLM
jgi:hypothetical protein